MAQSIVIFIGTLLGLVQSNELIISLPNGQIRGATYLTPNNISYYGFRGIPYAIPPLGELRFEPPLPASHWSDILDASKDGRFCISKNYFQDPQAESEDCLTVNVYTPNLKPKEKLPVMFWIYGGNFEIGSSNKTLYGPDFLVEKDVIVVSFNYRLGPFGFLSTADESLPGNMGLKDQVLALKWTKDNIEYFGGDPEKITIFGESSGAASVALHLLSKQSVGLFRAAILESGSSLVPWAINTDPRTGAYIVADGIPGGSYGNNTEALKRFLKNKTVDEIMRAYAKLPEGKNLFPVIEKESDHAFTTDKSHYDSLESGSFTKVPILIGICAQESLLDLRDMDNAKIIATGFDSSPKTIIPAGLKPNSSVEEVVIKTIKSIYLKDGEVFSNNLAAMSEFYTDNIYARGIIKYAEIASKFIPVYLYQFSYFGRSIFPFTIEGVEKAAHGAEIPFVFKFSSFSSTTDPNDILIQDRMVTLLSNFAKYLNPTPEKSELLDNIVWPTTNADTLQFLNINQTLEIKSQIREKFYHLWNKIFNTYGTRPFSSY